eukprot:2526659-Rhodomonas_salina.2
MVNLPLNAFLTLGSEHFVVSCCILVMVRCPRRPHPPRHLPRSHHDGCRPGSVDSNGNDPLSVEQ